MDAIKVRLHKKVHHRGVIRKHLPTHKRLSAVISTCAFSALLAAKAMAALPVDINTADAESIAENLNGIGIRKAEAIVSYRNDYGDFKSLEDIALVKGISIAILERNRELIMLD